MVSGLWVRMPSSFHSNNSPIFSSGTFVLIFLNLNLYFFGVYPSMRCKLWIQTNFCPDDYPVIPISFIELFIFPYYECEMLHLSYLKSHENMALYLGSLSISLVYALMHQDNTILITRGLCFTIWGIGPVSFSPFFSPTIFFSCSCLFHMSFKKKIL